MKADAQTHCYQAENTGLSVVLEVMSLVLGNPVKTLCVLVALTTAVWAIAH